MEEVGEAQNRDNPEGGELDPAESFRRCCKKNYSFILTWLGKRIRERGSEVGTLITKM